MFVYITDRGTRAHRPYRQLSDHNNNRIWYFGRSIRIKDGGYFLVHHVRFVSLVSSFSGFTVSPEYVAAVIYTRQPRFYNLQEKPRVCSLQTKRANLTTGSTRDRSKMHRGQGVPKPQYLPKASAPRNGRSISWPGTTRCWHCPSCVPRRRARSKEEEEKDTNNNTAMMRNYLSQAKRSLGLRGQRPAAKLSPSQAKLSPSRAPFSAKQKYPSTTRGAGRTEGVQRQVGANRASGQWRMRKGYLSQN